MTKMGGWEGLPGAAVRCQKRAKMSREEGLPGAAISCQRMAEKGGGRAGINHVPARNVSGTYKVPTRYGVQSTCQVPTRYHTSKFPTVYNSIYNTEFRRDN